jgi:hypothetical protein
MLQFQILEFIQQMSGKTLWTFYGNACRKEMQVLIVCIIAKANEKWN